ncbi:MAG: long-chain fatty acid--CoA ligase [Kiloniellales bacterium]|nr:long-chain fatty acid--CoA ligase [Kiloniellales bacterium]
MTRLNDAGLPKVQRSAQREPYPWEASYPPGVGWRIDIPDRPLWAVLDDARRDHPNRPALEFLGKGLTYAELAASVDRAAEGFRALGVTKGTRVGLFLPNCPYFVICFFGVIKAGGVVVTFNPLLAAEEVRQQVVDSGCEVLVTLDLKALYAKVEPSLGLESLRKIVVCRLHRALPAFKGLMFRLTKMRQRLAVPKDDRHLTFEDLLVERGDRAAAMIDPGRDAAVLLYTAGTTGRPKGVALTHRNLLANALQCRAWFTKASPGRDRILAVLPFFHAFGLSGLMNFGLSLGAELIILPRFEPKQVLKTIHRLRPTFMSAVPTMLRALLEAPQAATTDFSTVKVCISGGDSLPLDLRRRFEDVTGVPVTEGYGLSESGPVVACGNPLESRDKVGSVGLPLPGTVIEILSLDEARSVLPPGETGEICLRGPQIMAGYWQQPTLTRAALVDGRLSSGDLGYLDEEGYLFIVDRLKDVIISGGYTLYPSAIEAAICRHPDVAEASVVGMPDDYWGEIVKAFVVPEAGRKVTVEELEAFLQDQLSAIERPKAFAFRDSLPKSAIGKILKRALREA